MRIPGLCLVAGPLLQVFQASYRFLLAQGGGFLIPLVSLDHIGVIQQ